MEDLRVVLMGKIVHIIGKCELETTLFSLSNFQNSIKETILIFVKMVSFSFSKKAFQYFEFFFQTFHKQTDGFFSSLGILVLVFFIPVITIINYYILELLRQRSMSKTV